MRKKNNFLKPEKKNFLQQIMFQIFLSGIPKIKKIQNQKFKYTMEILAIRYFDIIF